MEVFALGKKALLLDMPLISKFPLVLIGDSLMFRSLSISSLGRKICFLGRGSTSRLRALEVEMGLVGLVNGMGFILALAL